MRDGVFLIKAAVYYVPGNRRPIAVPGGLPILEEKKKNVLNEDEAVCFE